MTGPLKARSHRIFAIGALSARQIRRGASSTHAHHHVVDADIVYKHGGSSFPEVSDKANYITTVRFVKLKTASDHMREKLVSAHL